MTYNWKSADEAAQRLSQLAVKPERYTDEDITELRALLARGVFLIATNAQTMQFRGVIDTIEAIREMNRASGDLVNTTNSLTRAGLWFSGGALVIAVVSLVVSLIALVR